MEKAAIGFNQLFFQHFGLSCWALDIINQRWIFFLKLNLIMDKNLKAQIFYVFYALIIFEKKFLSRQESQVKIAVFLYRISP